MFKNFEIGTIFPVDMSGISWGIKYMLNENEKFRTAIIGGVNLPIGNTIFNRNNKHYDNTISFAGGVVATMDLTDKTGFDFDAQFQKVAKELPEKHNLDLFVNFDYSYWITDEYQLIAGLNYSGAFYKDFTEQLLTLNIGSTIERHENFLLVVNSPVNIWGKNVQQIFGLGFALTISIK